MSTEMIGIGSLENEEATSDGLFASQITPKKFQMFRIGKMNAGIKLDKDTH